MTDATHVPLDGSLRRPLPGFRAATAAAPSESVELTLKLRRRKELPEVGAGAANTITYEELRTTYGASAKDADLVERTLASFGLKVSARDLGTRTLRVSGPVSAIERAFDLRLFRYAHASGESYRGRVSNIHLPKALEGIVVGVFGLDNRRVGRHRRTANRLEPLTRATPGGAKPWFFPADLAKVYEFPDHDGTGQCIALLEFGGGYFADDLASFAKHAGLASTPDVTAVSVNGTRTNRRDGSEGEVMLDVQVVAGICPKAKVIVYFAQFTEQGWIDAIDAAIHDQTNAPSVVSISWGDSEDGAGWTAAALDQVNEALKEAAMLGITVCVASGDDGSDDQVGDGHAHVDFPASSPYVLAVGGTMLKVDDASLTETAWKDGNGLRNDGGGSSGGGVSAIFDRPTWQSIDVKAINPGAKVGRSVPDVAANASSATGYFLVVDGSSTVSGGTSAAAPLWAALIARINAIAGKRSGYFTPLLYGNAEGQSGLGTVVCRSIDVGDNATAAIGGYSAVPGYDAVTGWGAPKGAALLGALSGAAAAKDPPKVG